MCIESFDHTHCSVLLEAAGIRDTAAHDFDPTRRRHFLRVFDQPDIPVSIVETYTGDFDAVFATYSDGATAGFVKSIGVGRLMHLGASLTADVPEDLAVFDRIAREIGCLPAFELSDWADVRLSRGENGSFLFVNNYQDDPVETTIAHHGVDLFGRYPIRLPARRGAILPIEWQVRPGVVIHYCTAEIVGIEEDGSQIVLKTDPPEFAAELSLSGYACEGAVVVDASRVRIEGREGRIDLKGLHGG